MKVLALLGGMTFESTSLYYNLINQHFRSVLGGTASAPLYMYSASQREMLEYAISGQWDEFAAVYIKAAKAMIEGGAEAVVICASLAHRVAEEIERNIEVPLLHIADFVGEHVKAAGLTKVALLGTRVVMEADYFKGRVREGFGIDVLVPDAMDRERVHLGIVNELTTGHVSVETKAMFLSVTAQLTQRGAEGLILGSTDLGFVIKEGEVTIPIFDTAKIHALGVARYALNETRTHYSR